jgi:hypothetical protein
MMVLLVASSIIAAYRAATKAYTCHAGPHKELYATWTEFAEWMASPYNSSMNHLQKGDTLFEIYSIVPETVSNANEALAKPIEPTLLVDRIPRQQDGL